MRYPDGGGLSAVERKRREVVRMAAAEDFAVGVGAAEIAVKYRVSRMSAWRWRRDFAAGGREGLRSKGPATRCRLDERESALLEELLVAGPAAHGWEEDQRWTLQRVCGGGRAVRYRLQPQGDGSGVAPAGVECAGAGVSGPRT
jgi:putative transposase